MINPFLLLSQKSRHQFTAATARRGAIAAISTAEWQQRQLESLQRLWVDAVADVPYYISLVASGRAPAEIRSWRDFEALPVLTRQIIQDRPRDFMRNSGPPDDFAKTAGSTGTPLRIGVNQAERDLMRIVKLTSWQQFG